MMLFRTITLTSAVLSLLATGAHADWLGLGSGSPYRPRPPVNAAKGEEPHFRQRPIFYPPTDPLFGAQAPAFKPKPEEDTLVLGQRKAIPAPPATDLKFNGLARNPFASACGTKSSPLSKR
jgi:hypothetical protein